MIGAALGGGREIHRNPLRPGETMDDRLEKKASGAEQNVLFFWFSCGVVGGQSRRVSLLLFLCFSVFSALCFDGSCRVALGLGAMLVLSRSSRSTGDTFTGCRCYSWSHSPMIFAGHITSTVFSPHAV